MLIETDISDAFDLNIPFIDVRSPGEFEKGHIPTANNIPLFSNDERAHVGTVYKQQSKEKAIEVGYSYVNPKLEEFITRSKQVAPDLNVIVHCWRGGMRSRSFAQHLSDNGFKKVYVVTGGYKAYRNYVLNGFEQEADLKILGGFTGSGKTYILEEMRRRGHQVIDLEQLANHKGSAFGALGQPVQPSVEQFENNLSEIWRKQDFRKPIWLEDESHNIGGVKIPMQLFQKMRTAPLFFIEIPKSERASHLVEEYAMSDISGLINSIERITRKLGGLNTQIAIENLKKGNFREVAEIALFYYDKSYLKGMKCRDEKQVKRIELETTDHTANAVKIERIAQQHAKDKINAI